MTHIDSRKQVVFGLDSVEIKQISTGKTIEKGIENHASKAYAFSHFMPYLESILPQLLFEAKEDGRYITWM